MIEECRFFDRGQLYRYRFPLEMSQVPLMRRAYPKPEMLVWLDENLPGVRPYVISNQFIGERGATQWYVCFRRYVDAVAFRMRF